MQPAEDLMTQLGGEAAPAPLYANFFQNLAAQGAQNAAPAPSGNPQQQYDADQASTWLGRVNVSLGKVQSALVDPIQEAGYKAAAALGASPSVVSAAGAALPVVLVVVLVVVVWVVVKGGSLFGKRAIKL